MSLYKKIAHVRNEKDTEDLYEELSDRYGEPPEPVLFLLDVALLRSLAKQCKILSLTQEGKQISIRPTEFDLDVWQDISEMPGVKLRVVIAEDPYLVLSLREKDDPLAILCEIFKKYLKISGNKG
jgi:transcription-repair coupling factor (superfamily II helicase)